MGIPIVIATNGYGKPITEVTHGYGTPVEIATNGYGVPVVIVASGGLPVVGSGGGGGAYDAASEAIFAAFTTPPTTIRKSIIDACVVALKAAGIWTSLDGLYVFAAADSQAAKINWVNPAGTYNATEVNAPTFTADTGFTGASTKYLDTGFNPTTATTPKFVINDATVFGWSLTSGTIATGGMIGMPTTRVVTLVPRTSPSVFYAINYSGTSASSAIADGSGLFSAVRSSSSLTTVYRNATSVSTSALVSDGIPNENICVFLRNAAYWTGQAAAVGFGSQLDAANNTALYNALNTYLTAVGAFSSYQAETNAIAAAFTTPPTTARKNLIDAAVVSLKSAGVWAKLDGLYVFAAADSQAAKINWKAPGTYNCTEVNAPVFTADQGFTGASTKKLDSGFNPATAPSPKYTLNSACLFGWSNTSTSIDADIAGGDVTAAIAFQPRRVGDVNIVRINQGTGNISTASTDGLGLWVAARSSSVLTTLYRNAVSQGTDATAATTVASNNMTFLTGQGTYWTGQISAGGFGQTLDATEQTALYNALRTYMTGVGVP